MADVRRPVPRAPGRSIPRALRLASEEANARLAQHQSQGWPGIPKFYICGRGPPWQAFPHGPARAAAQRDAERVAAEQQQTAARLRQCSATAETGHAFAPSRVRGVRRRTTSRLKRPGPWRPGRFEATVWHTACLCCTLSSHHILRWAIVGSFASRTNTASLPGSGRGGEGRAAAAGGRGAGRGRRGAGGSGVAAAGGRPGGGPAAPGGQSEGPRYVRVCVCLLIGSNRQRVGGSGQA